MKYGMRLMKWKDREFIYFSHADQCCPREMKKKKKKNWNIPRLGTNSTIQAGRQAKDIKAKK